MELKIEIEEELMGRLEQFKRMVDVAMGDEMHMDEYLSLVLNFGMERMLRDLIPEGQEWEALKLLFAKHPKAVSDLVSAIYGSVDEEEKKKEIEEKIKESVGRYIQ